MEVVEFIIIFFIALLIASIFYYGLKRRGPWGAFWVFLLILFLATWAGRLWITPAGPLIWGFAWLPIVFFVLIIAIAVGTAPTRYDERVIDYEPDTKTEIPEGQKRAAAVFGVFFWLLFLIFTVAIVVGLLR